MELPTKYLATLWLSMLHVHVIFFFVNSILFLKPANCLSSRGNETDRVALLQFKDKIGNDPYGILSSWNDSVKFCSWKGVSCGLKHQRVVSLNMQGLSLYGTISPYIGNLTFLRFLKLVDNKFYGEIPPEIGRLFRLQNLNLTNNTLGGQIPLNISYSSELKILDLTKNSLEGKIPDELGSLKKLVALRLGANNLTGEIPHSLGNLTSLKVISVGFNNLKGNIPSELGRLTRLTSFVINVNNLIGTVPSTLYNISSITIFYTTSNQLSGSLPQDIGLSLHNLQQLGMGGNQFHGSVPVSLANASQLHVLDISHNILTGQVPGNLGDLYSLERLNLEHNFLGNYASQDLSFITSLSNCSNLKILFFDRNNFSGVLPISIANLSTLQGLGMGRNQISGGIPVEIGNLVNLYVLGMEINFFSGAIPFSFGKLGKLQVLDLGANLLSGEIPTSLGNITQLYRLYLNENKLEGNITSSIGNFQYLHHLDISKNKLNGTIPQQILGLSSLSTLLDLSQNSLTGPLPKQFGSLKNIQALDFSENKLYGEIPETIGDCLSLEILNVQGNFLQGSLPSSFASLRGLQNLDLSRNNLSGNIPKELEKLFFLQYLNLSFNNFSGEVLKNGVFSNATAFSVAGNSNLCGGIPELQLPACPIQPKKQRRPLTVIILITTISSIVFFLTASSFRVLYRRQSRKNPSIADRFIRISYKELFEATEGFSLDNLIGQGSFGSVYKGSLVKLEDRLVAIKVLNLEQHGASKTFITECKTLSKIQHRNLVKMLTYCSSFDFKGNDFKALVFDFMENGSLEMWLHSEENGSDQSRTLNLLQRLHIAIDVASALHYLHEHCEMPIVHCDLKPSNILLDSNMTAHVGDFGLARFLSSTSSSSSQGQTSSIGMKGTIGYLAPEYGIGSEATTFGYVYSFGVILLEMFTRKRPTDEMFVDGLNLHNFVKAKLPKQVFEVVDPVLFTIGELGAPRNMNDSDDSGVEFEEDNVSTIENMGSKGDNVQICIVSVLKIGLACSAELPGDRMNMKDVTRKLNVIMDAFF